MEHVNFPHGQRDLVLHNEVQLEGPVRQPTGDVDADDERDQLGDLAVRALLLRRPDLGPSGSKADNEESVEDGNQKAGNDEPKQERVTDEGFLGADAASSRPLDVAGEPTLFARVGDLLRVQHDGQHDEEGHDPRAGDRQDGVVGGAVAHRGDRVADGEVAVAAHHQQREGAREHIDARLHVVDLAHGEAEYPVLGDHSCHQHGQPDHEEEVRDGEVEDVHVGHRLHLGVAQDDEHDEAVSDEADDAHEAVRDDHDGAERSEGRRRELGLARLVRVQLQARQVVGTSRVRRHCGSGTRWRWKLQNSRRLWSDTSHHTVNSN